MSKRPDPSGTHSTAGRTEPVQPALTLVQGGRIDRCVGQAHRLQFEDCEVVVLSDGHFFLPSEVVAPDATPMQRTVLERGSERRQAASRPASTSRFLSAGTR
jgi:hypothetical protein